MFLPYEDPTTEMLQQQAKDIAAAERKLAVRAGISGVVAIVGPASLIYAARQARARRASVRDRSMMGSLPKNPTGRSTADRRGHPLATGAT